MIDSTMQSDIQKMAKISFGDNDREGQFGVIKIDVYTDPPEKVMLHLIDTTAGNIRDVQLFDCSVLHHKLFEMFLRSFKL